MTLDLTRPVATLADVMGWQAKKNDIEGQIAAIQNEVEKRIAALQSDLADINKKLDAAAVLSPEVAQLRISTSEPTVRVRVRLGGNGSAATVEEEPITVAVVRIIKNNPSPMTAKQLRKALINDGYENSKVGNYLYTVFGRLLKRRVIVRHGDRYSLPLASVSEHQSHEASGDVG